ncbi:clock-controlled protein 8 [Histoplasma ohiense]|nr:clock-controlled protein 8 [Histoplasma ohiense (nom. inval.)]
MTSQIQDSPHPALPPYPDSIAQSNQTNAATTASSGLLNTTLPTTARMAVSSGPTQLDMDKEGRSRRATSVLSMDDIEAAQALEGLRTDFVHSPASSRSVDPSSPPTTSSPGQQPKPQAQAPEPLLSLLTSSHPLLSSAINSSVSVYTSSKSYSPRFKYGAEFLERNIGSPVVKKVGSVGKKTGVEEGIRWALQRRRAGDDTAVDSETPDKRRKIRNTNTDMLDVERAMAELTPSHTRRSSTAESLPPYDNLSSPKYEELAELDKKPLQNNNQSTWQSRLMISTSGLGVAMSEESLRSLAYCLSWLRWANGRLGNSIVSLKKVLEESDASKRAQPSDDPAISEVTSRNSTHVFEQIQQVKGDILRTLRQVVDVVSKYAGGALPENARLLVRRHLTSLPQRFRLASTITTYGGGSGTEADMKTSAQRVLVLAEEGLDMMAQVSGVVNDTLVSAESWCEKLRRPKPPRNEPASALDQAPMVSDSKPPVPVPAIPKDIEMTGMTEKL